MSTALVDPHRPSNPLVKCQSTANIYVPKDERYLWS